MSETRYDWLADRWTIFAPHRSQRPDEFVSDFVAPFQPITQCPFCAGQEDQTPGTLLTLPRSSSRRKQWLVRVVPNKFPAIDPLPTNPIDGTPISVPIMDELEDLNDLDTRNKKPSIWDSQPESLFVRRRLQGAHEVIIETPEHLKSLTALSEFHTRLVFEAFRRRLVHWRAHDALRYAVIFKNVGSDAGASLSHSHSQLIATNFVPPDVLRSCQRMKQYYELHNRNFFRDVIDQELEANERIVLSTDNFTVVAPFASQIPYFLWILPKKTQSRFEEISDKHLTEFSIVVRRVLSSLETLFPKAAYNFVLHTSPFDQHWDTAFHWRMELFPRLTKVAGFEWGSDCFINPILPEVAAKNLARFV